MSHAKLGYGGSVASRTMQCPGWVKLAATLPVELLASGGPAADLGTACHEAVDLLLRGKVLKPSSLIGLRYNQQEVTQAVLDDLILPAMAAFHAATARDWEALYTEQRVDILTDLLPPGTVHGTADIVIKYPEKLVVGDWKFGMIPVPADSAQLYFYAAGVLDTMYRSLPLDFPIELMVIQPRVSHQARIHETSVEGVNRWRANYEMALRGTLLLNPPQATGEHCKFCPCRSFCDTFLGRTRSLVSEAPELLNQGRLAELAAGIDLAKAYADSISVELKRALESGVPVPGWKRVQGRSRRTWADEGSAAEALESVFGEEAYTKKLLTPAAAYGKLAAELGTAHADAILGELIEMGHEAPRVVPESDPHPALDQDTKSHLTEALATLLSRGKL
jgi:hypothetical protein